MKKKEEEETIYYIKLKINEVNNFLISFKIRNFFYEEFDSTL
jgi:hypothetical protein